MRTPSRLAELESRPDAPLKIGVSQCLMGDEVRYDGTGARSSMPHHYLQGLFEYVSFCPEVGIGMSVPRPPIRLVGSPTEYRVVGVKDPSLDVTDPLRQFARDSVPAIRELDGYVFMHNSPSCGLFRVKVYSDKPDVPGRREARGAFAAGVLEALPNLPVEEAGRLHDDVIRENFVTRVFAYAHWRRVADSLDAARLIAFHSRYKYLLMAHSQTHYKQAGQLLSNLKENFGERKNQYISLLMQGLGKPATRKGHANVLLHLQGYVKQHLSSESRQELSDSIHAYRRGEEPLMAPLALLRHHFRQFPDEYVLQQSYLDPHPAAAGLRRTL